MDSEMNKQTTKKLLNTQELYINISRKVTFSHSIEDHVNKDVSPSSACTITMETTQKEITSELYIHRCNPSNNSLTC